MNDFQIPGFEMIEKIGLGGMAAVWKARQISLDRIVAIKMLSAQFAHDPSDVQRFQAEAQQAAKLKHAGIIQVYDASVEKGVYYYVMEYVAGYTVGDWVRRKGALREKDAILVCECVADALDYAWQKARIIHCDIKPDNIIVDSDGSVKVADLGLSRTINAMSTSLADKDVMGTPAYMAPEQAVGSADLDCRTDIYSLGATLYHLVTGKPLFEGSPDARILEMQVTDKAPDALDINPKISRGLSALIEKMLAKKREDRPRDWTAVRTDLDRVKRGLLILKPAPEGVSTIKRSARRMKRPAARPSTADETETGLPIQLKIVLASVLAVVIGVAFLLNAGKQTYATLPVRTAAPKNGATAGSPAIAAADPSPQPDSNDGRSVADRDRAIERAMRLLADETFGLVRDGQFLEAAQIYESYSGPMAAETEKKRTTIVADLKAWEERTKEARRALKIQAVETAMSNLLDRLTVELTTAGVGPALKIVNAALADEALADKQDAIGTLKSLLASAADMDQKILDGFKALRGQQVAVQLTDGIRKCTIVDVKNTQIVGQQDVDAGGAVATVGVTFDIKDLSVKERLLRMGPEESAHDVALIKGLMALIAKSYGQARKCLALTHPLLADRLVACVAAEEEKDRIDGDAKTAPPQAVERVGHEADAMKTNGVPALSAKLAGMVGNQGAIRNHLLDRNPDVRSREIITQTNQAGAVYRVDIVSEALTDIGAVAAFRDLKEFSCGAPPGRMCKVSDISAVRGLPLESLSVRFASVRDLSPLRGMALKRLCLQNCPVSDLSPLKDMVSLEDLQLRGTEIKDVSPIRSLKINRLDLGATRVFDIRPLSGMPLESLDIGDTQVKDIAALREMPLRNLSLARTRIFNFAAIKGLALNRLNVVETQFRDLSLLKDMPLQALFIDHTGLADISLLRGHALKELSLVGLPVRDCAALERMPLRYLNLSRSRVESLAFAKDLPLDNLDLSGTKITDLSPLKGMKLVVLQINDTRVWDLRPLSGMPLRHLNCQNTAVTNFEPLKKASLRNLVMDEPNAAARKVLRSLPDLDRVNGLPFER